MIEQILEWNEWQWGFLGLFAAAWIYQLYFMLRYFLPVARSRAEQRPAETIPVSVVISARNEWKNLMDHVPIIMEQDHPQFELIVVNDSSWDDTADILKALSVSYPNMHVINLDEEKQNMQGKKFALTLGIKAAKYDCILLTDADCIPSSPDWIRRMTAPFGGSTELILGFSPYSRQTGWLNKIIRFDTLLVGIHYLGFAKKGVPYMGVGRNLCYSRDLFFKHGGFKNHYRLASGDDDLFVNQAATARNTAVVLHPDAQTVSAPKTTWSQWFTQKRRHFTTAPLYKASHRNKLASWPMSFLLMMVGFGGAMVLKTAMLVVGGMLLVRYITQVAILRSASGKLGQGTDHVWLAPVLEMHLHALNLGLYISNLVRKPQKWS